MPIQILDIGPDRLPEYSRVPSRFIVRSILQPDPPGGSLCGIPLHEVPVPASWSKDYDSYGELPTDWPRLFDVTHWAFLLALNEAQTPLGAAAVAFDTPGLDMLERRRDLTVLWDIRVSPQARGLGIPLFRRAAAWSREHGCHQMKVETQNVNLPACRFYQRMGCELGQIHRFAYASTLAVRDEIMLCWYLRL